MLPASITGGFTFGGIEGNRVSNFPTHAVGSRHIFKGGIASIVGEIGGGCSACLIKGVPKGEIVKTGRRIFAVIKVGEGGNRCTS